MVPCACPGFGVALSGAGGGRGGAEFDAAGLVGAGGETAQGGGRGLVSVLPILVFLRCQNLQIFRAVVFVAGLAEKKQLLVVFPFGHVGFVRCPACLDRLELAVKNSS